MLNIAGAKRRHPPELQQLIFRIKDLKITNSLLIKGAKTDLSNVVLHLIMAKPTKFSIRVDEFLCHAKTNDNISNR
jgi:hypothetical protein